MSFDGPSMCIHVGIDYSESVMELWWSCTIHWLPKLKLQTQNESSWQTILPTSWVLMHYSVRYLAKVLVTFVWYCEISDVLVWLISQRLSKNLARYAWFYKKFRTLKIISCLVWKFEGIQRKCRNCGTFCRGFTKVCRKWCFMYVKFIRNFSAFERTSLYFELSS